MNDEEQRPRGVREEASFTEQKATVIQQLGITEQEFDYAYLQTFDLQIALEPSVYPQIEDSDLYVAVTRPGLARYPSLRIAYSFDDELIHLWYVDINPVANGQES